MILGELKKLNQAGLVKVINVESSQEIIKNFIQKNGIPCIVSQFEMIKWI